MALFVFRPAFRFGAVTMSSDATRDPQRLTAALWLTVRRYAAQVCARPGLAIPALILPGVANALIVYVPPLIVARLLAVFARGEQLSAREVAPYILAFAGVWLAGEGIWRVALGQPEVGDAVGIPRVLLAEGADRRRDHVDAGE